MENALSRGGLALCLGVAVGCGRSEGKGGPIATASASAAPSSAASAIASAVIATSAEPAASGPLAGGSWITCYAHFAPISTPLRDVTRLGLLCGPRGGMRQRGAPVEGTLEREGASKSFDVELKVGDCVRAFAVGEESLRDLDLELRAPSGQLVTRDHVEDRWPILDSDRPICVRDAGSYAVIANARRGSGAFALSVWVLPDE